ncbi:MAG: hypothetical protein IKJ75_01710 [Clostridia bacterium]|nr:hypothetical protein [Clostridia bacterium]
MYVYYVDNINGSNANDGFSPDKPIKDYKTITLQPGDTIKFKRGTFYREQLKTVPGTYDLPITFTSYGEGDKPVFCASFDVSKPDDWQDMGNNIWKCLAYVKGDVGNFVFNEDECTASLCWEKGDLSSQGDFWDNAYNDYKALNDENRDILLYSQKNPALYYNHIECVAYNERIIANHNDNIIIDGLHFRNSGVHAIAGRGRNVTVRNCEFMNIGGCVWSKELKIRFGNGVEFWTYGEDILIENCYFKNIYDSCVTHQGPGDKTIPTRNFICRNNIFDTYGMAAFEYRDKMPISSYFVNNICLNAGCGFAMLGEELPRYSEIWPQPMGHHIFLWRIPEETPQGSLKIKNNIFGACPVGAAIYSIISPEAEAQMKIDHNVYLGCEKIHGNLINRFAGKDYSDFTEYQKETGMDANSVMKFI